MIRIDGPGRTGATGAGQGVRRTGTTSTFKLPEDQARAAATLSPGGVTDVSALMLLQEVEDPLERRRRGVKRGTAMLDELEQLKLDLLAGTLPPDRLDHLTRALAGREPSGDERLDGLLEDIELRVRVELAKSGRYPD